MAVCSSCGAPIIWARTEKGRRMPLDPGAREDGNVARLGAQVGGDLLVEVLPAGHTATSGDPLRFVTHFVTCPHADQWRKERRR